MLLHQLAAPPHEAQRVDELERASGDERGVFSEAVSGNEGSIGEQAALLQGPEIGDAGEEDGGLLDGGLLQRLVGAGEDDLAEPEAERSVGPRVEAGDLVIGFGEVAAHADPLRALTGEDPGDALRHGITHRPQLRRGR